MSKSLGSEGTKLIQAFEDLRLEAYQDEKGIWTIGWGHTGREVVKGMVISRETADLLFEADVRSAVGSVNTLLAETPLAISQSAFDALVSFVFNIGHGHFASSTMLRLLKAGDFNGAKGQFKRWVKAGPNISRGLIHRRAAEEKLFDGDLSGWRSVVKVTLGKDVP